MKWIRALLLVCMCSGTSGAAWAQLSTMSSEAGDSYYYTDHFEVVIAQSPQKVWPRLLRLGEWIPWLADSAGTQAVSQGQVLALYDQFVLEVVSLVPEQMLVLVNLPAEQQGESSQGIVMLSLREVDGRTVVSMFMSRAYFWFSDAENELQNRRMSPEFAAEREQSYSGFLQALKDLVETEG